jgi:hypothetical protein
MTFPVVPNPSEITPMDPDEFRDAYEYAMMIADNEFLEHVPAVGMPLIEHEGKRFALSNSFITRFSLAAYQHFEDADRGHVFMWRIPALFSILDDPQIENYCREEGGSRSVHPAVLEVAAIHPLNARYQFAPASFFEDVERVVKRMETDLDDTP